MSNAQQVEARIFRFIPAKGFGFAVDSEDRTYFVHVNDFIERILPEVGDIISFVPIPTEKGFKASEAVRVSRAVPSMPVAGSGK